jgi:hypothetical protein
MENFPHISKEATMLTAFCLAVWVCGAEPQFDPPVSAEAAVQRARFEAEERRLFPTERNIVVREGGLLWDVKSERCDLLEAALFAMPVARVNQTQITAGRVLERYRSYLLQYQMSWSTLNLTDGFLKLIQELLQRELPSAIERELLWQAAQRDLGEASFQEMVAFCQFQFDNQELLKLAGELASAGDPATVLAERHRVTIGELRQTYVRERVAGQYLNWKAPPGSQRTAQDVIAAEWKAAAIHTAYELPPRP